MNSTVIKFAVSVILLAVWAALAFSGRTDVAPLVSFIQATLIGLAAHTLTMVNPNKSDSIATKDATQ